MEFLSYSAALEAGYILDAGEFDNGVGVGWDDEPDSFDVIAFPDDSDDPIAL